MAVSLTAAIAAVVILIAPAQGAGAAVFAFAAALVRVASALRLQQNLLAKIVPTRAPEETHGDNRK